LAAARQAYDVIVVDTPPSMSQATFNAFHAADAIIVPMPTSMLEYEASIHFWRMFSDLSRDVKRVSGEDKIYQFIHVVPSIVDSTDSTTDIVRQWLFEAYPDFIVPTEIPKTGTIKVSTIEYKTVYDITRYNGAHKTYRRARDAYDRLTDYVAGSIEAMWARAVGTQPSVVAAADIPESVTP
jgi:chromosome partitioning protein